MYEQKLTKLQMYLIIINVAIFVLGNFVMVLLSSDIQTILNFPRWNILDRTELELNSRQDGFRILTQVRKIENDKVEVSDLVIPVNTPISLDNGYVYESQNDHFFLMMTPLKMLVDQNLILSVDDGFGAFRPVSDTILKIKNQNILFRAGSLTLIDASLGHVYCLKGEVLYNDQKITAREKFVWAFDNFVKRNVNYSELVQAQELKSILEVVSVLGLDEEFKVLISLPPPELLSISPADGHVTFKETININGNVRNTEVVLVNNTPLTPVNNKFSINVPLSIGTNEIKIVLIGFASDMNYQTSINIIRSEPIEMPVEN